MTLLEELRRKRGWTQIELAKNAKVGETAIVAYERRHRAPGPNNLAKLARALGVRPGLLADDFAQDHKAS